LSSNSATNSEILSAKRDVERAKEDLTLRLRAASKSSRQMLERTLSQTKPILTAVAALGAAAVAIGLFKLARPRPRRMRAGWLAPPREPSLLAVVARSALASAAASLASQMMARLQQSLEPRSEGLELPAARVARSHNRP
jgi:hypothetical protein